MPRNGSTVPPSDQLKRAPLGEMREALMGTDGMPILGDVIAVRGLEGCMEVTCTRMGGRCIQWHCPRCLKPTDAQGGHQCSAALDEEAPR